MRVDERMTKNICCCRSDESLAVAAKRLWDSDCGCLPVVDKRGNLHGMITDRDICMAAMTTGKPLAELRIADAMAKDVACVRPTESLHEAELTMRMRAVRRLPVVDDQNRVIGLLTCNDLFRWVDDGGSNSGNSYDAVHLVRTLATIGRGRRPVTSGIVGSTNSGAADRALPSVATPSRKPSAGSPRQTPIAAVASAADIPPR